MTVGQGGGVQRERVPQQAPMHSAGLHLKGNGRGQGALGSEDSNASIRREAAWCISNITAGTINQINAVVEAGLVQRLAELVKDPINDIAREATWAIANCVSGADLNLCFKLANNLAMQGLIYIIIHHQEPTLLGIALEGLYNFFKNGEIVKQIGNGRNPFVDHFINEGAIDYLEKLQEHNNKEIYNITIDMLDQFFPVEQK